MKSKNKILITTIVILLVAVTVFSAPEIITMLAGNDETAQKNETITESNIQIPTQGQHKGTVLLC